MEKRVIIATVLSMLVIMLWFSFFSPTPPRTVRKPQGVLPSTSTAFVPEKSAERIETATAKTFTVESPRWKIVFNSFGASIRNWYIKEGKDPAQWPDLVLNGSASDLATFPGTSFTLASQADRDGMKTLTFRAKLENDVDFTKTFELSEKGALHQLVFDLKSSRAATIPFSLTWGPGIGSDLQSLKDEKHASKVKALHEVKGKPSIAVLKPNTYDPAAYQWIGMDNRYFTINILDLKPFDSISVAIAAKHQPSTISLSKKIELSPAQAVHFAVPFYLGPKHYDSLKDTGHHLESMVELGFFAPLTKIFLSALKLFHAWTNNYGIAIIIMTVILQIITIPLTIKSTESAKSMKLIQPKMKLLQEKYKADPKRLNAEVLHLYRTQKINPLSGCLPMILQLPIFWALFAALQGAYELRKAPFLLWVTDLSKADPYYVLPIMMGLSMFFQQKISGASIDPSQKTMMYLFPVIFTIIFLNFPSGLVLYWFINNLLVTSLQYFVLNKPTSNQSEVSL